MSGLASQNKWRADNEDTNLLNIVESLENKEESITPIMVTKAIENAAFHGIHLSHGVKNLDNGDCLFESIIDSINTRDCFQESFDGTPAHWRNIWMSNIEEIAFDE